jgi:hypothetical protein
VLERPELSTKGQSHAISNRHIRARNRSIISRCFLPVVITTVTASLGAGFVASASGGVFWLGALYAFAACLAVGALATVITAALIILSKR